MSTHESATSRLSRVLTMVPGLLHRQGIDIEQAASELGVSREQIEADLQLLFVCGTPGHMPDDLIEADWESGRVYLGNADLIARPLRLGVDEALALIVGLRTLASVPGIGDRAAIDRALAKLEEATGAAAAASSRVQVTLDVGSETETLQQLQRALAAHRRVHLRYLVAARDEATERDVDPMRVLNIDATWYLEAWCHRAEDVRLFRLDRIESLEVLDQDGTPPEQARPRDLDAGVFTPSPTDQQVRIALRPEAAWVSDYYPVDSVERADDGSQTISLRTADTAWLRRLLWRLGGGATVLEPQELAAQVSAGAEQALRLYDVRGATAPEPRHTAGS
jgi:proteasome accessory factor C